MNFLIENCEFGYRAVIRREGELDHILIFKDIDEVREIFNSLSLFLKVNIEPNFTTKE